ncbi:MAG: PAS domain S-box protein [Verrucomicrobia bacterium]|nr:PAS domain S-box protein [Verrucomicrobiota bacterium]
MNSDYRVVHLSEGVGRYLRLSGGEANWDVLHLVPQPLRWGLRWALDCAAQTEGEIQVKRRLVDLEGAHRAVTLRVQRMPELAPDLYLVAFEEADLVPSAVLPSKPPLTSRPNAKPGGAQVQPHDLVKQYEASVEELKASNEALQALNEELRTTTDEVEASREELQSINEELGAVNQGLKSTVAELIQLNTDLQNFMAATQIATVFLDRELRIVRYTPAAVALFNLIPTDVGRPLSNLRYRLAYESLAADAERTLERLEPVEREVPGDDGRWYLMRLLPYRNVDGCICGVVLTFVDITERKAVEAALRQSEERYRALVTAGANAVWRMDGDGKELLALEGGILRPHHADHPPDRAWLLTYIHPEDRQSTLEAWLHAVATRSIYDHVHRCLSAEGEYRHAHSRAVPLLDAGGHVREWVGTTTDIDALKHAEAERHRREEWFGSLIQNASDLITVINGEGLVRFQSPSVERTLGYGPEDLLGRSIFEFLHPEDAPRVRAAIRWVRSHSAASMPVECRFYHRKGDWRVLQAIGRKMPDGGSESLLAINSRDVTARKQLEAQLHQAQKMEAFGQLAGGVAHDFNNLLSVIFGHAALLAPALATKESQAQSLAEIRGAAERAAALTRQLLAFSRQQVLEPKVVDLNAILVEAKAMLRRLIGEDVRLVTQLEPRLRPVKVDPGQIAQVIVNLAVNARDAMPRGGTLTLETRNVDGGTPETGVRPGRHVLLTVTDTGCGMSPEVQARAFEPFFTTKGEGKGTGLGLAVVHGIIQQSGGRIWLESRPGAGTRFQIYLPAVRGTAARPSGCQEVAVLPVQGRETILLAEDEDAVREVTAQLLEAFGYQVLKASSGEEALRLADSQPGKIHLLMTDVVMPGMGGRELADLLRAREPQLKVLFQSGYTDDAVVRYGVVHAEVAFLQKPFTPQALAEKVRQALDQPQANVPGIMRDPGGGVCPHEAQKRP